MKIHRALPSVAAIAMAGLLSGCGGSSSSSNVKEGDNGVKPAPLRIYSDLLLPSAVAAKLTLASGKVEDLPEILPGESLTWGPARFICRSDTACMVKLKGTSAGVRGEKVGDVDVVLVDAAVSVGPGPSGGNESTPAPISVKVVRSAAGMTEEALRKYIRKDAIELRLDSQDERNSREEEIRNNERKGEPLYQDITMDNDKNVLVNGDGSVTQSSTTHAQDMQVSVAAWMKPLLKSPGSKKQWTHSAGFSGVVKESDGNHTGETYGAGVVYSTPSRVPNVADDITKWQPWSTRIDHTATLQVDAGWTSPENEDAEWKDARGAGIEIDVTVKHAETFPEGSLHIGEEHLPLRTDAAEADVQRLWVARLRQLRSPTGLDVPGGRTVDVALYTDIGRSDLAKETELNGFRKDDKTGIEGTMHTDWRRGLDVIDFDDDEAKSPGELESGEREVFNVQRPSVTGKYRGIPGLFTCTTLPDAACHIRRQTDRVNVMGNFKFTPNTLRHSVDESDDVRDTRLPDNIKIGERVWNSDWLAIGVWNVVPDSEVHGDYEAGAFADGSDPFDTSKLKAAEGKAIYTGLAHGLYTETRTTAAAVVRGRFTANANLTADFGSESELGTISGRLRGFTATGGANAGNSNGGGDWSVNLERIGIGAEGSVVGSKTVPTPGYTNAPGDNHFTADTSGFARGNAIEGRWGGRFYGNRGNQPGYVAGTFGAASKDGPAADGYDLNLIGAFAARRPGAGGDGDGLELSSE